MKLLSHARFLTIYSATLTTIFALTVLSGFANSRKRSFDEIYVHRINIVEPDGSIRMILSNTSSAPGLILKGKEYPHPNRKTAGILFFDEEGTESGGLIFGGKKDGDKVRRWGHLSFDQYDQDQVFSIDAGEENGKKRSGITISDRGDYPILDVIQSLSRMQTLPPDQQQAELKKFASTHPADAPRAYFGRAIDGSVGLRLKDANGRDRLRLRVDAGGSATIQLLDENGKVTTQIPAAQ